MSLEQARALHTRGELAKARRYLDTLPFNGGASAADALAAGVPVVTCAGEAFASRMASSLLNTVGMPELATTSLDEYRKVALALISDREQLTALRAKLLGRRAPLFDAPRFCQPLELAYQAMWERSQRGQAPASIAVEAIQPALLPFSEASVVRASSIPIKPLPPETAVSRSARARSVWPACNSAMPR